MRVGKDQVAKLTLDQALLQAKAHARKGELEHARALYKAVLEASPNNKRARHALSALQGAKQAASSTQELPKAKFDALVALYNKGQFEALVDQGEKLTVEYPASFLLWNIFGAANAGLGRLDQAVQAFRKASDLNPRSPDAHNNIGNALKKQGKLDAAIAAYRRALAIKPDFAEAHYNLGYVLQDQGKLDAAIAAYRKALAIKPDFADAHNNIGNALQKLGRLDEAVDAYSQALAIKPDFANAHYNIGVALKGQGKLDEAIAAYRRALAIKPDHINAQYNMGNALRDQGKHDAAIAAYRKALAIKPDYARAEAQLRYQQRTICDWDGHDVFASASERLGIETAAVSTFAMLSMEDDAQRQMLRSRSYALETFKHSPLTLPEKPDAKPDRLRIGYFSADFCNHATLYLLSGLLHLHDRSQFELFAYSYGRAKSGEMRDQVQGDVDLFTDIADMSDRDVLALAHSHELDIAIDLKGYTQHSRSELFAYRLAPIQINYLGYPGTMSADFIDYIIADAVVIPNDQRKFYTERIIYMPHTYQPNDDRRIIAKTNTTRSDFDLPEDAFVFCCFNNNYKISRREFDIWMRLLNKVDGSVLWLLKSNEWAEQNLRKEAVARGIDPARLVFAKRLSHSEHLARHKHADLFIDTFNCNAHTTASDALWGGLPVVTRIGRQFAARVSASLLNAIGLPELVTETEDDYETLILELAASEEKLARVKTKLDANRLTHPLFDSKRYTCNFESGLRQAFNLYFEGKPAEDIWVTEA
ncbi:MAG: tetratricopeptide repeat protein [Burkholderiales bacterium]|nr:tetratricopeptide repeat protein [Burkholderiales bacterium]